MNPHHEHPKLVRYQITLHPEEARPLAALQKLRAEQMGQPVEVNRSKPLQALQEPPSADCRDACP